MLCRWRPVALVDMGREGSAWEKGYEGWCSGWSCRFSVTQMHACVRFPVSGAVVVLMMLVYESRVASSLFVVEVCFLRLIFMSREVIFFTSKRWRDGPMTC